MLDFAEIFSACCANDLCRIVPSFIYLVLMLSICKFGADLYGFLYGCSKGKGERVFEGVGYT
jgi:hypothetical protein